LSHCGTLCAEALVPTSEVTITNEASAAAASRRVERWFRMVFPSLQCLEPSRQPGAAVSRGRRSRVAGPSDDGLVDSRSMARKRIAIRPPGLKPTTKVGTIGPYRGRLGFAWVV